MFSGVQPTGNLHLGNYLGALKKFAELQDEGRDCLFCVVDLHAITVTQEKGALPEQTRQIAAAMLACGIDPKRSILFVQSSVLAHSELAWYFNCVARLGWLERMTQFKEKAGKDRERSSVGLFDYPVLQAADILAYKATHVPVGEDQKQHLELSRDIADRFNREFDAPGFFPLPEPLIKGPGAARPEGALEVRTGLASWGKAFCEAPTPLWAWASCACAWPSRAAKDRRQPAARLEASCA